MMVSLWLLPVAALLLVLCAGSIAKLRGLGQGRVRREAAVSGISGAASVLAGIFCYAIGTQVADDTAFRNAGAALFLVFPAASVILLNVEARRRGFRPGSSIGAFVFGLAAVVVVGAWATYSWKGPRGGWGAGDVILFAASVVLIYGSAACLGWWCGRKIRIGLILLALSACFVAHKKTDGYGSLQLTIVDGVGNRAVPARITIRDSGGKHFVPDTALPVFADCTTMPLHNWVPAAATLQARRKEHRGVRNPQKGSTDFYIPGTLTAQLPPGRYWLRVEKGPEYNTEEQEFVITSESSLSLRIALRRWVNLPEEGWFSSDDHLHIPRPSAELDPVIATWMQAEDIHVGNMLQMGMARDVHLTPQRAFGAASVYQSGGTLLAGGQENPRTHLLGHGIVLGQRNWIDFPASYLLYDIAWREAHRQGALAGYAHFGMASAQDGLALWGQSGVIDFIEVLNVGFPYYESWYDALNLGERVVPTAGTDYPCVPVLPGRERFYTKLEGPLTFPAWVEAVRRGRTFVTNGPALDFSIDDSTPGDTVALAAPGTVRARARVRFDASRDQVDRLEIVQAGQVVATAGASAGGEIAIEVVVPISASTWLAARASGDKVGERPAESVEGFVTYISRMGRKADGNIRERLENIARANKTRISSAHTAAIYVTVNGSPTITEQEPARQAAKVRLDLLDDLAARLEETRWSSIARYPGSGDGV
ncbi:MAG: CehA/McbA family metallohydrolase, partial [Bryobacterales bacterium]|nr:CehA/McbA family metallohydrolase [Bryobacterales bacterium]